MGFPGVTVLKNPPANEGNLGSIPGSGRSPVEGNGNPLQYSCLGNPMNRGVWRGSVHGVAKSWTWLSTHTHKSWLLPPPSRFSRVWLSAAQQAPPSLGFSRQEHWSGLPFPSPMHESETWKWSRSVMSDSLRSHGLQPTRLLRPWDFPDKSTGVGCHCLLRKSWLHTFKGKTATRVL